MSLSGVFFVKGLVVLSQEEDTACLSLGFRRWAAQSLPLTMDKMADGRLAFVVPTPAAPDAVQRPHWLFNDTADVTDARWKGCSVEVMHPACVPPQLRGHTCVLIQTQAVEPLVKAALRSGSCFLDVETLKKVSQANKVPPQ